MDIGKRGGRGGLKPLGYGRGIKPAAARVEASEDTMVRHVEFELDLMGFIIGKGAKNLRAISHHSNTKVYTKRGYQNTIYIEGNTKESLDEAETEINRIAVIGRKHRNPSAKDVRSVGVDLQACGRGVRLTEVGHCRRHPCYRLVLSSPEENSEDDHGVAAAAADADDNICVAVLDQSAVVLDDFRRKYLTRDKGLTSHLFTIWYHIGQIHCSGVNEDTDDCGHIFSSEEAQRYLSKTKHRHFDGGIEDGLDVEKLKAFLQKSADHFQSYVRHDATIMTPKGKKLNFKVWIPMKGVVNESPGYEVLGRYTGSEKVVGTKVVIAGPGLLCHDLPDCFKGDIAFPDLPYDCRLLIKAGPFSFADPHNEEIDILVEEFCEKAEIDGSELHMPAPPDGFRICYERRCKRECFTFNGYLVTLSDEQEVDKHAESGVREKVDVKVGNQVCDTLLSTGAWKPKDILPEMKGGLSFIKRLNAYIA